MDLDIPLPRTRGRAPKPVNAIQLRELTSADLALLSEEKGSKAPEIKAIRDSHHKLARLLASGCKPAEASLATGYSLSRISILLSTPAFQELLATYREGVQAEFYDFAGKMATLAASAVDELNERLEAQPEDFSTGQLLDVVKTMADRSGFGPSTKSTNVNVNVDLAGRLEAARRRASIGGGDGPLIEGESVA